MSWCADFEVRGSAGHGASPSAAGGGESAEYALGDFTPSTHTEAEVQRLAKLAEYGVTITSEILGKLGIEPPPALAAATGEAAAGGSFFVDPVPVPAAAAAADAGEPLAADSASLASKHTEELKSLCDGADRTRVSLQLQ